MLTIDDRDAITQARELLKVGAQRVDIALQHSPNDEALAQLATDLHLAADHTTAAVRALEQRLDPERGR